MESIKSAGFNTTYDFGAPSHLLCKFIQNLTILPPVRNSVEYITRHLAFCLRRNFYDIFLGGSIEFASFPPF